MHEFSVVQSMVEQLLKQLDERHIWDVAVVRLRRGVTLAEEVVRQAFRMATHDTPLEGVELLLDVLPARVECGCGHHQLLTGVEVLGHVFVCPDCGTPHVIDGDTLELVYILEHEPDSVG